MVDNEKYAIIFPGQGTQFIGMGKSFYDKYDFVKDLYKKADEILGFDISSICFEGPIEKLTSTKYNQPAILTTSIAYLEVFKNQTENYNPSAMAGLSLGEYSALVGLEVLSFEDALKLVCVRGQLMEEAGKLNPGGMVSVIGLDRETVKDLCGQVQDAGEYKCEIANLNCPGQIVVSCSKDAVDTVEKIAKEVGARKAVKLNVSGAFHSSLMESAKEGLEYEVKNYKFSSPQYDFITNVTAEKCEQPADIKKCLVEQLASSVLWEDSIRHLSENQGIKKFVEVGPGNVLKGLLRRIDKELICESVDE